MKSLEQMKARAEAATPGPWVVDFKGVTDKADEFYIADVYFAPDKPFIAHARTDIPRLIRALEKAIEQRNKMTLEAFFEEPPHFAEVEMDEFDADLERILNGEGEGL